MSDSDAASAPPADMRQPKSWLAALLSLLLPGLGQLYLRRWKLAVLWMVLAQAVLPLIALAIVAGFFTFPVFLFFMAAIFGLQIAAAVHAFVWARRTAAFPLQRWTRWYGLLGAAVAYFACGFVSSFLYDDPMRSFHAPSSSMQPAIMVGDRYVAVALYDKPVERGEIVIFHWVSASDVDYVKRVVALPGDSIELRDNRLLVNDKEATASPSEPLIIDGMKAVQLEETLGSRRYRVLRLPEASPQSNFARRIVPPGHVFVLGDNRDNSQDSRFLGPVRIEDIDWRVSFVFWSRDLGRIGVDLR